MGERGFVSVALGDGRPLLAAVGASLIFSGGFAIFLGATGQFLPHDVAYLGMDAGDLCAVNCRFVDFMIHDRVAWGGALVAVGVLYLWLVALPLSSGEPWAWWLGVVTGVGGFATFLSYIRYGYLDTWHGLGTLLLAPVYIEAMRRSRRLVRRWEGPSCLLRRSPGGGAGRALLELTAAGLLVGGLVIMWVGVTDVFVPQDLAFMSVDVAALDAVSARLVPLMAHDRAGFGGANAVVGLFALLALRLAGPTRGLLEALAIGGLALLGGAVGVHYAVGYTDATHLAPAWLGAGVLGLGLALAACRRVGAGAQARDAVEHGGREPASRSSTRSIADHRMPRSTK